MAVGNVGESLDDYDQSDTFISRNAGFTWEEVHKDAHLWEFGDSGSILIMANDEGPTDHVMFSTDEGASWREYKFTDEPIRVQAIVTVPNDTSRKFILLGYYPRAKNAAVAVHIDFSALTKQECVFNPDSPGDGDFELWSPSEEREEQCLFGRRVWPSLLSALSCSETDVCCRRSIIVADVIATALWAMGRKYKTRLSRTVSAQTQTLSGMSRLYHPSPLDASLSVQCTVNSTTSETTPESVSSSRGSNNETPILTRNAAAERSTGTI